MKINFVTGDATRPIGDGNKIIVHICNDVGGWGAGFVLAISQRWKRPQKRYRELGKTGGYELGTVDLVQVEGNIWVANMIAQQGIHWDHSIPPIRYPALEDCLLQVAQHAKKLKASVHMPRIGCGLAGGKWDKVEEIVSRTLGDIPVTVYDLPH
ncbi:MAG TPA: macro domain-containing protein [Candidatus Paceibacterota bacterium]